MATREKWLTRRCMMCEVLFRASRHDARLCSSRCRQRWCRQPEDRKRALVWADFGGHVDLDMTPEELDAMSRTDWPGGPRLND